MECCPSPSHAPLLSRVVKVFARKLCPGGNSNCPQMFFASGKCSSIGHLERSCLLKSILLQGIAVIPHLIEQGKCWSTVAAFNRSGALAAEIDPVKGMTMPVCLVCTMGFCTQSGVNLGNLNVFILV